MTAKNDLVKKIKYYFDLNIYESKVWLALLNKSIASVGEIAEISGVPRSRVYDVLESLEKRGFAIAKLGKPIKYIAVKPAVVIEHMKSNVMNEAEEKVKNLSSAKDTNEYRELEILHTQGIKPIRPEDLSSAIMGRQNIYSHMKELIKDAKKEVTFVSTVDSLKQKTHFLKPIFEELKTKGVSVRIAAGTVEDANENVNLNIIAKELGIPIKQIKINSSFVIIDNSKLIVFVTPENGDEKEKDMAIWINSPFFSKAMTTFLNPVWKR